VTLTREALNQLDAIVALAITRGARAINFIAFNPFIDQSDDRKRSLDDIPRYRETARQLVPVLKKLEEHRIEANVRYMPFCVFPDQFRKYVQNFQQIVYDLHEWESAGEVWSGAAAQRRAGESNESPTNFYNHVYTLRDQVKALRGSSSESSLMKRVYYRIKPTAGALLKRCNIGMYDRVLRFEQRMTQKLTAQADVAKGFKRDFYLEELGEVPGFSDMEYAYKEFRVLMPKTMHPYEKDGKCSKCDLLPICDGFHRDYACSIGFDEAEIVSLGGKVFDPRHYIAEQMKVVEKEEFQWALAPENTLS
jgi:hypothetical protein